MSLKSLFKGIVGEFMGGLAGRLFLDKESFDAIVVEASGNVDLFCSTEENNEHAG